VAGFVFVSYSRDDREYVKRLVAHLRRAGLEIWVDDEIHHGEAWVSVVSTRIDECAAFVVVMSPAADSSEWVRREITRAQGEGKPILPLLLAGRRPLLQVNELQYEEVDKGRMPSAEYVARLGAVVGTAAPPPTPSPPPGRRAAERRTIRRAGFSGAPTPLVSSPPAVPPRPWTAPPLELPPSQHGADTPSQRRRRRVGLRPHGSTHGSTTPDTPSRAGSQPPAYDASNPNAPRPRSAEGGTRRSLVAPEELQRIDAMRRTFTARRYGSGYDAIQVNRLFDRALAVLSGRSTDVISSADLDPKQFSAVPGGYFEAEVNQALRELRDLLRP
jgi:hypothetical protein